MRWIAFAKRNTKEILRDPLTLLFGVGFPVILLLLSTAGLVGDSYNPFIYFQF